MFGRKQMRNALLPLEIPDYFQSLDYAIEQLVRKHGVDAVREATKRLARKRTGRKQEVDLALLNEWFNEDAMLWLDGGDPFKARSNYAMANHVASLARPNNRQSVYRRVMRKLSKRRRSTTAIIAWEFAEKSRPYRDYFRATEALLEIMPKSSEVIQSIADTVRGKIERYKQRFGEPDPEMSVLQMEEALARPVIPDLNQTITGLLGTLKA